MKRVENAQKNENTPKDTDTQTNAKHAQIDTNHKNNNTNNINNNNNTATTTKNEPRYPPPPKKTSKPRPGINLLCTPILADLKLTLVLAYEMKI